MVLAQVPVYAIARGRVNLRGRVTTIRYRNRPFADADTMEDYLMAVRQHVPAGPDLVVTGGDVGVDRLFVGRLAGLELTGGGDDLDGMSEPPHAARRCEAG